MVIDNGTVYFFTISKLKLNVTSLKEILSFSIIIGLKKIAIRLDPRRICFVFRPIKMDLCVTEPLTITLPTTLTTWLFPIYLS